MSERSELRAYGQAFRRVQMRGEMDIKIRQRLERQDPAIPGVRDRSRGLWLAGTGLAVAAVVLLLLRGAFAPSSPCAVDATNGFSRYRGSCRLEFPSMQVTMAEEATLHEVKGAVTLLAGAAHFRVAKVPAEGSPVVVHLPDAEIHVLGTEFDVDLRNSGGEVRLLEGRIRFVRPGQSVVELRPGERVAWSTGTESGGPGGRGEAGGTEAQAAERGERTGRAVPTAADGDEVAGAVPRAVGQERVVRARPSAVAQEQGASGLPARPGADRADSDAPRAKVRPLVTQTQRAPRSVDSSSGGTLARIMSLRAAGRFAEALSELERVVAGGVDAHAREVLSFERGVLLDKLGSPRACATFAKHNKEFRGGRYSRVVGKRLARCPALGQSERTKEEQ